MCDLVTTSSSRTSARASTSASAINSGSRQSNPPSEPRLDKGAAKNRLPLPGEGPSPSSHHRQMAVSTVTGFGNLPTTIAAALQPSTEARIITEPDEPFRIVHVNEMWCRTCGFDAEEVLGQTCKFLHGPGTCGLTLSMLKQALQLKRGLAVQLLNYTKAGRPFTNTRRSRRSTTRAARSPTTSASSWRATSTRRPQERRSSRRR